MWIPRDQKRLAVLTFEHRESGDDGGTSMGEEMKTVLDVKSAVSMHVDETTGRHYSYNEATGHTQWLSDDDDDESEAKHVQVGESKQQTKKLFRKFVDDDGGVYYEDVGTGEVVWEMPDDGEFVDKD